MIGISAGNHAQALAYCAALEASTRSSSCGRERASRRSQATRAYGAEVDLEADGPADAFDRLHELMDETGRPLVHPFDDPIRSRARAPWGWRSSRTSPDVEVMVVPVGGGGLISGIAAARKARRVVAVEPELSTRCAAASKRASPCPSSRSRSPTASARPSPESTPRASARSGVESLLVTEDEIADGLRFLYGRAKLACEPAAAVGVAALLAGKVRVEPVIPWPSLSPAAT